MNPKGVILTGVNYQAGLTAIPLSAKSGHLAISAQKNPAPVRCQKFLHRPPIPRPGSRIPRLMQPLVIKWVLELTFILDRGMEQ